MTIGKQADDSRAVDSRRGGAAAVVLILAHELGHFLVAKLFGVKVLRFSLGFWAQAVQLHGRGYRVSSFRFSPWAATCAWWAREANEPVADKDARRALCAKPLWQRFAIVMAGPLFNLILPIGIYFVHYLGQRTLLPPTPGHGHRGTAAANAGLMPAIASETVDGRYIRYWEELERGHQRLARPDHALRYPAAASRPRSAM